ncbi:MAG: DNA polymerase III subunit delta' C-terminal domain-containing protein [Christensenellales bacterium]|jgi:DNA polymerase-3 subunit delta'
MTNNTQETFLEAAANKNISGAYLIVCSRISVADRLANAFLIRLYCKKGGCGICTDCQRVKEGHIDIMRLTAPKIAALREAISFVAEKAYNGSHKCVVIKNADDMTDAAANSILKTLEQPPNNTVFLLEARAVTAVLPTIVSRCTSIYIKPEKEAKKTIAKKLGVDDITAHILRDLSGGFLDEALLIYSDKEFWQSRAAVLEICQKLLDQKNMAISAYADYLETNKERIKPLLCVMQSYFMDILIYKKTKNEQMLVNRDKTSHIKNAAQHFTSGAISNMINVILKAERWFFFPVNFRLAVEKLFFDILEEKNKWKK